jgi:hypothetical protein
MAFLDYKIFDYSPLLKTHWVSTQHQKLDAVVNTLTHISYLLLFFLVLFTISLLEIHSFRQYRRPKFLNQT